MTRVLIMTRDYYVIELIKMVLLVFNFDKVLFDDSVRFGGQCANRLFPGVERLLRKYRDMGHKLIVISNRQHGSEFHKEMEDVLTKAGIDKLLELWVVGQEMRSNMLTTVAKELHMPEDTPLYLFDFWARDVVPGPTRILTIVDKHDGLQENDIWEALGMVKVGKSN